MSSYINWKKDDSVTIKYVLEYIDNKRDADIVNEGKHDAPWELYKRKETEDFQQAIESFVSLYTNKRVYDVKLRQEIYVNGELALEQVTDTFNSIGHIRTQEQRDLNSENQRLNERLQYAEQELQIHKEFFKKYGNASVKFEEFQRDSYKEN